MIDKTRLFIIKAGFFMAVALSLVLCFVFYVGFFLSHGQVLITLNDFGEMNSEGTVWLPVAMFLIFFAFGLCLRLKVE